MENLKIAIGCDHGGFHLKEKILEYLGVHNIEYKDFGNIKIKLDEIMTKRNISTYELSKNANIRFQTIKKLREGLEVTRINLDVLAKLCYVLECRVQDLIEYEN